QTVSAATPEISADFSTAGTLLADGAATGPTTASESVSGIAAKVRGLSSFAMSESSFPETLHQPATQDKISVTRFPPTEEPSASPSQVAADDQHIPPSRFQDNGEEPVSGTAPWYPAPEPSVAAYAAIPAGIAATTSPWQPEVGHLHPETGSPANPNQIASSVDTTPRTIPIAPEDSASSSMIEPEPEYVEPRSMAQSPWLPAAAGAAIASSTQSQDSTEATSNNSVANNSVASQQAVAASEKASEQPSEVPEVSQQTINPLLAAIQKPFSIFSSQSETQEKEQTVRKPIQATYASQTAATMDMEETPPQKTMPLGLEGYCPVALMETGNWVEGQARWGARHRGRTYLFSGLEQQQTFLSDPDRYSPALSGDDPVAAIDGGQTSAGQRRYGVTYQQRIYLFESPETRAAFAANPQRYTSRVLLAEQPSRGADTVLR
ncbi:MAG: hypothetical protein ISR34_12960, partial [Pirellulales bacterium]|nr:hypothetical protein [Pirellulales bacterium]